MEEDGTTYARNARRRCLGAFKLVSDEHSAGQVGNPREDCYERSCYRIHCPDARR
jgi:hypothetical protein